jgi:dolichol-phosphate mannosyltransferase
MRLASGDAVVLLDGDLQDPPELIEEMVARWREGYDVVYGERIQREASLPMQLAFKAFYRLYRRLSYIDIPVDAGDFSLIDRRVLNVLNTLPEKNRFVRGLRAWVGFRQTAVRYVRPERPYGRSTNNLVRNLGWARKAIFSFSFAPLELITVLALVTVATSFLAIVTEIAIRLLRPQWVPPGLTTVIVIILFMGGIQLLCLSIIGSYLAHIYDEVKGRPPYVVNRVINPPKATGGERRAKPVSRSD